MGECGRDISCPKQGPVAGTHKYCNKSAGSTSGSKLFPYPLPYPESGCCAQAQRPVVLGAK